MKKFFLKIKMLFERVFNCWHTKDMKLLLGRVSFIIRKSPYGYDAWADVLGCTKRDIRRIVHKRVILSFNQLKIISKFGNVSLDWILTGKEKDKNPEK